MLEPIGEPAVRMTTRVDNHQAVDGQDVALEKTEKVVEERPIENTEESAKSESDASEKSGAYDVGDEGVYFEKYDKDGNVIYRVPPEQKPIDELA
ncbi:hypothetical protein [Desulfosarcina ovata]|uniref:Uncharacterized protein n=1 Tax=Desulfosarcina ovata subsp. ovata TaxID=2752305 RepID=A0A5K8A5T1_9BACT|nr:hypothetical protein [Desulfosarcina ovata]BBO87829.1 hypothetical protein DSCOOX_10090 [Desulfosarcina ovata subsp. ovata]